LLVFAERRTAKARTAFRAGRRAPALITCAGNLPEKPARRAVESARAISPVPVISAAEFRA
jgi:hypothetical protein